MKENMNIYLSKTLNIIEYDGFHLIQDHIGTNFREPWNDYGYIVKFNLYYVSNNEKYKIGALRFLIDGEVDTYKSLSELSENKEDSIIDITSELDNVNGVSIGIKIDYYRKLRILLDGDNRKISYILRKIKDASFNYRYEDSYSRYDGYDSTILREGPTVQSILTKGYSIAIGSYSRNEVVSFSINSDSINIEPVEFNFNTSREIGKTNINLIIGKNGSGKTHILHKLSARISGLEEVDEQLPFFHKLIVSAYSPFESFLTKEQLLNQIDEKKGIKKKKKNNRYLEQRDLAVNKYTYIGFKNKKGEFDIQWPREVSVNSIIKIMDLDWDDLWIETNESRLKILFDTLSLSINFDDIAVKCKNKDDNDYFILTEDNYREYRNKKENFIKEDGLFFLKDGEPVKLSSGQEIFSYMIPTIVAEIEEESLLIIDEPELYLHPTLEVGLIHMLKNLLKRTKSYAVIATHSSVIAREVSKDGIAILRRESANHTVVTRPNIQTYGETLEVIMGEAFDDYYYPKPFQIEIDQITKNINTNDFLSQYSTLLGDEALAYTLSSNTEDGDDILIRGH
ncbi:AAA family ATPase [Vibrio parahaemolyticus]|uniref:AAA family ATPase n=1 Tax=Vibrio parahaemolyticus TaxID=670 RepID=UPI0009A9A09D|nr:AAA family ATPase [Vibrio parahaemolyticus]